MHAMIELMALTINKLLHCVFTTYIITVKYGSNVLLGLFKFDLKCTVWPRLTSLSQAAVQRSYFTLKSPECAPLIGESKLSVLHAVWKSTNAIIISDFIVSPFCRIFCRQSLKVI